MTTKTSDVTVGDFLLHEESEIRCREVMATVTNPTAAAYDAPVGSPLKSDGTIALQTEEASIVGFTLKKLELTASGTASNVPYIARDAAINEAKIPDDDPAGDAYTMATVISTVLALGIVARYEPTKSSTQTN